LDTLNAKSVYSSGINNDRHEVIDLITGITSNINNNTDFNDDDHLLCDYCDVKLIEKKGDVARVGYSKNRWIYPSCGRIKDPLRLEVT
jgi:hypothetical protein